MQMTVVFNENQRAILHHVIADLTESKKGRLADDLRRAFDFDLANLQFPTDDERRKTSYASMH